MIATKRNGDKPQLELPAENVKPTAAKASVEHVKAEAVGNLMEHPEEPKTEVPTPESALNPLKLAVDAAGRVVIPDKLVDPYSIFAQPMVLPGIEGLPFRGSNIPDLKETDPDKFRPQTGMQIFANVLSLSEPSDLQYYQRILQLVGNGYAQISVEERKYDNAIKSWRVFIRWILYYHYIAEGVDFNG